MSNSREDIKEKKVQFKYRTQEDYLGIGNTTEGYDDTTIYFTDSGNTYLGNKMMGTAIKKIEDYEGDLPLFGIDGIVYHKLVDNTYWVWSDEQQGYIKYTNLDTLDSNF